MRTRPTEQRESWRRSLGFRRRDPNVAASRSRGVEWLLAAQDPTGGWGGTPGIEPSVEETALAVHALASPVLNEVDAAGRIRASVERGATWLARAIDDDRHREATPIGFYFANLWYFEALYPLIFAVGALGRARALLESSPPGA